MMHHMCLVWRQLTVAALLIAVANGAGAAGLTIAVSRSPLNLPLYVAESQGYFAAEGVQVSFKDVLGSVRAMQQLADDTADLATGADTPIVFNSVGRNDFVVLTSLASSSKHVSLVASKAVGYSRPNDLVGKRIGTVHASSGQFYADSWLIYHGIDPKRTRMVSLQLEDMRAALAKGEVDAVAVWEPYRHDILVGVPGTVLLPDLGLYTTNMNLVADRRTLDPHDDKLMRVLRVLLRAEQFIYAEPGKARAILRERLNLTQDEVDRLWPNNNYRIGLDQSLITSLESQARWARAEGHITGGGVPNYLRFIYADPLRRVRPDRVRIGN